MENDCHLLFIKHRGMTSVNTQFLCKLISYFSIKGGRLSQIGKMRKNAIIKAMQVKNRISARINRFDVRDQNKQCSEPINTTTKVI